MSLMAEAWSLEARAILPLPPPSLYVEYASSIVLPDGRGKNQPYNPATHPPQLVVLQALDGGTYFAPQPFREVAIAKPVQDGGSLVSLTPLLRRVIAQRQTALIAFPSLDSAKDVWTTKVVPILSAYGGQEPESGGGSRGGAARVVTLPSGGRFMLRAAGGRGESQQASVTGDALCIDELDDWPDLHRVELITKRTEESSDPLLLMVCTVKRRLPEKSLILTAVAEGTNSRLHYACPDCGWHQPMEWANVVYERQGQACVGGSARIKCANCGSLWDEVKRRTALSRWLVVHRGQSIEHAGAPIVESAKVVGPIPDTPRFSILWNRIESPRKSLHSLCAAHARAAWHIEEYRDHDPMRSFVQDYLTSQYLEPKDENKPEEIDPDYLRRRSEKGWAPSIKDTDRDEESRSFSRHIAEMPPGAEWCQVSVDVQADRAYWLLTASDSQGRTFDAAWGYEHATRERKEMDKRQLHGVLDRIDGLIRDIAGDVPIAYRGVDANYRTDEILDWLKTHFEWWPVYGASAKKAARMQKSGRKVRDYPGILYLRRSDDWKLRQDRCHVDTHSVRLAAQRAFLIEIGAPGAAHLPSGLTTAATDLAYLQHLCGEQYDQASMTWKKPKGGGRHDWLDCRTYNMAFHKLRMLEIAKKATPDAAPTAPQAPAAPGWIDSYTSSSGWQL